MGNISQIKQDLDKRNDALQDMFFEMKAKNNKLEKQVEELSKDLKEKLKSATKLIYSFEPVLNTFGAISDTLEGKELIKKIREAKLLEEIEDSQEEVAKSRANITKANPIQKRRKT